MKKTGRKSSNVKDIRKAPVKKFLHSLVAESSSSGRRPYVSATIPRGRNNTSTQKAKAKMRITLSGGPTKAPKDGKLVSTPPSTRKKRRTK